MAQVVSLPRGGLYVGTAAGPIQFGIPPETIKDSMSLGLTVPALYVVPPELFDRRRGVNVAECEFPAYYNFFLLKRRIRLLVPDAAVEARLRAVFQESLFGPSVLPQEGEFADDYPLESRPDFVRESDHFRRGPDGSRLDVETLVDFVRFDRDGVARIGAGVEVRREAARFIVTEGGEELASVPLPIELPSMRPATAPERPFEPPAFGLTVLGSSHGFDPAGKTTGFILWVGGRGLLVDPPVDATEHLRGEGVPPKLIDGIILTHCHADHDSGTFQKILEEGRVTVFTTPTILGSFLKKYSALSGVSEDLLRRTFNFAPAKIGAPVHVHGAELWFHYTLHSIPTVGFEVFFGGKSLAFSADSLYDPARIRAFEAAGVLAPARAADLIDFPWHHSVVLHEAGVPPLHTPASVLAGLPDDVKERLFLVHIAEKDVPAGQGLKTARVGMENTIAIDVEPMPHREAIEILNAFCAVDLFREFTLQRAGEILNVAKRVRYPAGQLVIGKGTEGDKFYVIAAGQVSVILDGDEHKSYQAGDYFGETALLLGQPRNADVVAKTDVVLVEIDRYHFHYLLRGTDIPARLTRLARVRAERSWEIIEANAVLRSLTSAQKTRLQSLLTLRPIGAGEVLWRAGTRADRAFLVEQGAVVLEGPGEPLEPFGPGAFLGEFDAIRQSLTLATTARVVEPGRAFLILRDDLVGFFQDNPGVLISFLGRKFAE